LQKTNKIQYMDTLNIKLEIPNTGNLSKEEFLNKLQAFVSKITKDKTHSVSLETTVHSEYGKRKTDEELEIALSNEPLFDKQTHSDFTDEQYKQIIHSQSGKLTKGLQRWL
jgi:hypothetical protein